MKQKKSTNLKMRVIWWKSVNIDVLEIFSFDIQIHVHRHEQKVSQKAFVCQLSLFRKILLPFQSCTLEKAKLTLLINYRHLFVHWSEIQSSNCSVYRRWEWLPPVLDKLRRSYEGPRGLWGCKSRKGETSRTLQ